jgi:murein DD-endopeptidase MepM/ murein hydrolase activator NlpD
MGATVPVQSATGRDYPIVDYQNITQAYHVANARYKIGYHTGVDYGVPIGTPIFASEGGTVEQVANTGRVGYGRQILIRDFDGTYELYGHLSSTGNLKQGDQVATGTQIAQSGNTGNSTGPHLHFEVRSSSNYGTDIDPLRWLGMTTNATTHAGTVTPTGFNNPNTATVKPALVIGNPVNPGQTFDTGSVFSGFNTFLEIITDGQFWIRVLEIALGSFLILFGVGSLLGKQVLSGADIASLVKSVK